VEPKETPSPESREESNEEMNGISEIIARKANTERETEEEAEIGPMPPFSQKQIRSPTIKDKEWSSSTAAGSDPDPRPLEDGLGQAEDRGSGVGFFQLDEEIASPGFVEVLPFETDEVDDLHEEEQGKQRGGRDDDLNEDMYMKHTFEYSGSVPIDIVKPSGSWVGSFGH
jgi:hypothetical protein